MNCLNTEFSDWGTNYFNYIKLLIDKYRFTEINTNDLYITASEMNSMGDKTLKTGINPEIMKLWATRELYNISLSYSNLVVTNSGKREKAS